MHASNHNVHAPAVCVKAQKQLSGSSNTCFTRTGLQSPTLLKSNLLTHTSNISDWHTMLATAEVRFVHSCSLQLTSSSVYQPSWPCMLLVSVCAKGLSTLQWRLWGQGHPGDAAPEKPCLYSVCLPLTLLSSVYTKQHELIDTINICRKHIRSRGQLVLGPRAACGPAGRTALPPQNGHLLGALQ